MSGERATPDYFAPESVADARRRLAEEEGFVKVVAGGQTLMLLFRQGFVQADALVDVSRLPELSGLSTGDGRARVGATTTYADLAAHEVADRVTMLGEACNGIADRQVRNAGTIGGALCHADPAFDIVPPLLCLDAEVSIASEDGHRRLPLSAFLVGHMRTDLGPDELLEGVAFDLPAPEQSGSAYEKHAAVDDGWTTVGAATLVTVSDGTFFDVRVGLTAVADTAVRSPAVESALVGNPVTEDAIEAASEEVIADIDPLDDLSGSAEYKRGLAGTLVARSLATATDRAGGDL
jgi:carbon-monoxide dehydrogenase medium subunit